MPSVPFTMNEVSFSTVRLNAPIMDYVKTSSPWLIEVYFYNTIDSALFYLLASKQKNLHISCFKSPSDKAKRYFLSNTDFTNSTNEFDVRNWTADTLRVLEATILTLFPSFGGIHIRDIYIVSADGHAIAHAQMQSIDIPGSEEVEQILPKIINNPALLADIFASSKEHPEFRKALYFFAQSITNQTTLAWANLYKTYEIAKHSFRNKDRLSARLGISKPEISRFTRTANHPKSIGDHARHSVQVETAPDDPISYQEAVRWIARLLSKWQHFLIQN